MYKKLIIKSKHSVLKTCKKLTKIRQLLERINSLHKNDILFHIIASATPLVCLRDALKLNLINTQAPHEIKTSKRNHKN